jgi:hypothetical protein
MTKTVICQFEECGEPFEAERSTARFCCQSHRQKAHRRKWAHVREVTRELIREQERMRLEGRGS